MLRPPDSILLVITRRIGDVLLTTPLLRSLRQAWPRASISVLVFKGTEGVLAGNADIDQILTIPERPSTGQQFTLIRRIWRRYDLALSALPGDRPTFYAWAAGKYRIGMVPADRKGAWKSRLLHRTVPFDDHETHTVVMALRLADVLGIPRHTGVVVPEADPGAALPAQASFAILHPYPKFNYKMWTEEGWIALAHALQERGLQVLLTGGPDLAEVACCERIAAAAGAVSLAGRLTLGQTGTLLKRARLFVGPDTAITHIAAATGIPSLALFGPTNPVKWGPWPADRQRDASPWSRVGSARLGNVHLLQGLGDCVPCHLEGCDRHPESFSRCLQEMPASRVIEAALALLKDQQKMGSEYN